MLAAGESRVIVQPFFGMCPNVKLATSFPVFFKVRLAEMEVPGSPTATPEDVSSADQISAMLTETLAVEFLEMVPGNVPQSDVASKWNSRVPAEGYGKSNVGLNANATFP